MVIGCALTRGCDPSVDKWESFFDFSETLVSDFSRIWCERASAADTGFLGSRKCDALGHGQ